MLEDELSLEITNILLGFKIQPDVMGFEYLRTGIRLCFDDESLKKNITKKLYPLVAQIHGTTAETVERGMRTAIENAYYGGGLLEINERCGIIVYNNDFKWTNGETIFTLVELIKLKIKRNKIEEFFNKELEEEKVSVE